MKNWLKNSLLHCINIESSKCVKYVVSSAHKQNIQAKLDYKIILGLITEIEAYKIKNIISEIIDKDIHIDFDSNEEIEDKNITENSMEEDYEESEEEKVETKASSRPMVKLRTLIPTNKLREEINNAISKITVNHKLKLLSTIEKGLDKTQKSKRESKRTKKLIK